MLHGPVTMSPHQGAPGVLQSAGVWTIALGLAHMATAGVFYRQSLVSIRDGGVAFSVEADPELSERRGVGFWYITSGLLVTGLGVIMRLGEKSQGQVPKGTVPVLVTCGLWGVLMIPRSPFWLLFAIACRATTTARRARRQ